MSPPVENLVSRLQAKRSGKGWIAKCPAHEDHNPSLSISEGADGRALIKCHAGCDTESILAAAGMTQRDLFPATHRQPSEKNSTTPRSPRLKVKQTNDQIFDWRACVLAFNDELTEQIAEERGFSLAFVKELRDAAMIGSVKGLVAFPVHHGNKIVGAHYRLADRRTWNYVPKGISAAPLVFGEIAGRVHIFESTWDGLAFMDKSGERDGIIIARGSSNAKLVASMLLRQAIGYVWPQNDEPNEKFIRDLVDNAMCPLKRVTIPVAHLGSKFDLNDWTRDGATVDDLIHAVGNAEVLREAKLLSFRSPEEILAMPQNPHANFLGDRLLGIAQQLVIAGIGGIGKSRMVLQLLVALILECVWCGFETHHTRGKPWMLVQTQNGTNRLQTDWQSLKKWAGRDWSLVDKNLKVHTLETDRDLMLHLSDPMNVDDLESAIREFNPIGVAYDPLVDFSVGDLSKDVDMAATCSVIGRVSRAGNPERAIIVATHAITGLAGMKKAFGFESAGFGRNSKVLQTWARAFINIVPANEDYSVLVLTCGKNNDGKMFEHFAIRRTDEMIYEVDAEFDVPSFREQLERPKKTRATFSAQIVADMDWPKPAGGGERGKLDKKQLIAAVVEETNCSPSTAYRFVDAVVHQGLIRYSKLTKIYAKK
jgi:hypothetical protein